MTDTGVAVKLMPCPFCGSPATHTDCGPEDAAGVICTNVSCQAWLQDYPEPPGVLWNRRVTNAHPGNVESPTSL